MAVPSRLTTILEDRKLWDKFFHIVMDSKDERRSSCICRMKSSVWNVKTLDLKRNTNNTLKTQRLDSI